MNHSIETLIGANGRAYLLLTATALCWGINAVLGKFAVGEISPMLLVVLRWLGVLILLVFVARQQIKRDWPLLRQHLWFIALLGVLGFTAFNALFYIAAHSTSAVNIGIIQGSVPVFVLIGVFIAYRTRVTTRQIIGVIITMLGVITVAVRGDINQLAALAFNWGDVLMIVACFFYAGYAVSLRQRPNVGALSLFSVMAVAAFVSAIPLLAIEAALGQWLWPTTTGWIIVILVALLPSFLAQIFFIQGVSLIGPSRAGIFVNLVPVFAAILAVSFLKEPFETFHALALVLVLGGIWLAEHKP